MRLEFLVVERLNDKDSFGATDCGVVAIGPSTREYLGQFHSLTVRDAGCGCATDQQGNPLGGYTSVRVRETAAVIDINEHLAGVDDLQDIDRLVWHRSDVAHGWWNWELGIRKLIEADK